MHGNNTARSEVTAKGGLQLLLQHAASKDGDIQEAALACLVTVLLGHERNCRLMLSMGIDVLVGVAGSETTSIRFFFFCIHIFLVSLLKFSAIACGP